MKKGRKEGRKVIEILILPTRIIITCLHTLQQTFFALLSCVTDGTDHELLVKSICKKAPKSLLSAPTCVPGFEYAPWLAC